MAAANGGNAANQLGRPGGPPWTPDWKRHEGWSRNFVKANLWRVRRSVGDHEDCMQECRLIFYKCVDRYQGKVDNPAWFMSLYMRAVHNAFADHATRNEHLAMFVPADDTIPPPIEQPTGPLLVVLSKASGELKEVLRIAAAAPSELLLLMFGRLGGRRRSQAEEAAISRSLCRLARTPNLRSDLLTELREILRSD